MTTGMWGCRALYDGLYAQLTGRRPQSRPSSPADPVPSAATAAKAAASPGNMSKILQSLKDWQLS